MANKTMKTLTIGENIYEIVDEAARKDIEDLKNDSETLSDSITNISVEMTKKAETSAYTGMLVSDGWSNSAPYTQTITVSGILSTDTPFVDINLSGVSDGTDIIESWNYVGRVTVTDNETIVAYCYEEKPTVNIPIILKVVR